MLPYSAFGALRLRDFVDPDLVEDVDGWEFMDQQWVGEVHGFTEFLRLERRPHVLRSLSVDLRVLPEAGSRRLLDLLGLPLVAGMGTEQVVALLGPPSATLSFVADRTTCEFVVGRPPYDVSCTVQDDVGLTYVTVSRPRRSWPWRRRAPRR